MKAKAGADLRKPNPAGKRTAPKLQKRESFEPVAATKTRQSRSPTARGKGNPTSNVVRADYRAVRAAREGKKYINLLIDEELQLEVRARMMLRKLTWESLIESLLQKWLDENPNFRPRK